PCGTRGARTRRQPLLRPRHTEPARPPRPTLRESLVVPDHLDRPVEAWERQGLGLGLDRVAPCARETFPGVDPHGVLRPSPDSADLAFGEERARPDAGRPETLPLVLARNENL